ncbi:hypothetical protein LTR95_015745 [Oleoguttula sp. CCFEE 5521]
MDTVAVQGVPFDSEFVGESGDLLPLEAKDEPIPLPLTESTPNIETIPVMWNNQTQANKTRILDDEDREARWDQMRFMACADYGGHVIGYYDHSPGSMEQPTQTAYRKRNTPEWAEGCQGHAKALTDNAEWACDIDRYGTFDEKAQGTFMGTITYGYTGFNYFMDDGHATHRDKDYGMCYAEIYCTHQRALSVELGASKATAPVIYRSTVTEGKTPNLPSKYAKGLVLSYLEKAKERIGKQQCGLDPIPISGTACSMTVECVGDKPYLEKLVDTLLTIFKTDAKDLFKPYDKKDCTAHPPICNPDGKQCKFLPDICDYYKGVEMPSQYAVSVIDKAPPNSGETSPLLGNMKVTMTCAEKGSSNVFCSALSLLLRGLSVAPAVGGVFGAGSTMLRGSCT